MLKKLLIFLTAALITGMLIFFNIHSFLSPHKPVKGAQILVIDAWLIDKELDEAVKIFNTGNYSHVLVLGGPLERSLFFPGMEGVGDLSAITLMHKGIPHNKITPLLVKHVKKDRTYQAALTIKNWMKKNNISSYNLNLFTSSTHSRRSWLLYNKAFAKSCKIGIIAASPVGYDAGKWWRSSNGFRTVVDEAIAYLYAFVFFHPDL